MNTNFNWGGWGGGGWGLVGGGGCGNSVIGIFFFIQRAILAGWVGGGGVVKNQLKQILLTSLTPKTAAAFLLFVRAILASGQYDYYLFLLEIWYEKTSKIVQNHVK